MRHIYCSIPAAVLVVVVSGLAQAAVVDDFNDNSRDALIWDYQADGNRALTEIDQRLEYTSLAPAEPGGNEAGYILRALQPFGTPWTVTIDVHVDAYSSASAQEHAYGIAIGVMNAADEQDSVWFGLERGWNNDYYAQWFFCKETDNVDVSFSSSSATGSDGTLELEWDGSSFYAGYDEGSGNQSLGSFAVSDWNQGAGSTFTVLIAGYDDDCDFGLTDGTKMYADNFEIIPEPTVLLLLATGGLTLVRRRSPSAR